MITKLFGKEEELVWKDVFFKDDFSVDKFLSHNTNKSDLVSLRRGLKKYGTDLHKCMSEILKNETEAIVSLAEALSNLTSKIDDLSKPASQLQEEIRALYEAIKSAKLSFDEHLKKAKAIGDKREFLNVNNKMITTCISVEEMIDNHFKNIDNFGVIDSSCEFGNSTNNDGQVDLLLLERAVTEYSFQKSYSQRKGFNMHQNETVQVIERKLNRVVDQTFVEAISGKDDRTVERCLRMYVNLKRQQEAETIYKDKFARPALKEIFNQKTFDNHSQQLNKLYEQALLFAGRNMSAIVTILHRNRDLKGYNFIINSFWKEINYLLRDNLPHITAPGNPELFQRRFKDTWQFLMEIAAQCGDADLVRKEVSFQDHIRRFNLPVYFEIRFQQIAGRLEKEIIANPSVEGELKNRLGQNLKHGSNQYGPNHPGSNHPGSNQHGSNDFNFKLKVTVTFWECFQDCFRADVFIDHLTGQFVKLSMLLLSRYLRWLEGILEKSPRNDALGRLEEFIILSLADLEAVQTLLSSNVFNIIPKEMQALVKTMKAVNTKTISTTCTRFQENLISLKLQESQDKLQEVAAVPRIYRRTNRSVPTEPSIYIVGAVDPVVRFHKAYESLLREKMALIMDSLISKMTVHYLGLAQEVLHSVGKTEQSLRRLKNRNLNLNDNSGQGGSDLNSDEGKIREQIRLDVEFFVGKLGPVCLENGKIAISRLTEELRNK